MFRRLRPLAALLCLLPHAALADAPEDSLCVRDIERVEITGTRPMKEIGVQRTKLDSIVLRDNISSSLADALTSGSTIFIKSYGRATLATASFRGTSPSHTQVTWNGMKINSPLFGQVDFSLIPAYFIDDASLYHGASSVGITGGGLGGAVALATRPVDDEGFRMRYIQGIGSFTTFDEFLQLSYRGRSWSASTRVLCSTSENDFRYRNYHSKEFETDANGNIIGTSYPLRRNRNGAFRDIHLLQELYHTFGDGSRLSVAAWYLDSHRGLPLLSSDRNDEKSKKDLQDERTLRATVSWERLANGLKLDARAGYTYTDLRYQRLQDPEGQGNFLTMTDSRSYVHSLFARAGAEYALGSKWLFTLDVTASQHMVNSGDFSLIDNSTGEYVRQLDDRSRFELSGFAAVKWRPVPRLGVALNLREELYGDRTTPLIPALFVDWLASKRGNVVLKASAARNYRYPTLNDLYFQPGGNPDLRPEQGWTFDAGGEFSLGGERRSLKASLTFFDSEIDDWILWLSDGAKSGIYTPVNVKRVHSYGTELKFDARAGLGRRWSVLIDGNYAWTRSINRGDPFSPADESVGKQLVYIPEHSAAFTAKLRWRSWELSYKWCWYSARYTMSSNDRDHLGYVPPYFMSDIALEKLLSCRWADFTLKGCINNLFNEEYETVMGRPMPRLNCSFFIGITPKFGKKR